MAALVQTYPQQTTVTVLPTRPASSSAAFGPTPASQHSGTRGPQMSKYNSGISSNSYRGLPSAPVASYAYPRGSSLGNSQGPYLRPENRTLSAPVISHGHSLSTNSIPIEQQQLPVNPLPSLLPASNASNAGIRAHETPILQRSYAQVVSERPRSTVTAINPAPIMTVNSSSSPRSSPDRYRRNHRRLGGSTSAVEYQPRPLSSAMPSGSGMAAVGHLYNLPALSSSSPAFDSFRGHAFNAGSQTRATVDDMNMPASVPDLVHRHRRRSAGSRDTAASDGKQASSRTSSPHSVQPVQQHTRNDSQEQKKRQDGPHTVPYQSYHGSSDSLSSTRSGHSSRPSSRRDSSSASTTQGSVQQVIPVHKQEVKLVNVATRNVEPTKRTTVPSPLSGPVRTSPEPSKEEVAIPTKSKEPSTPTPTPASPSIASSPAMRQLAAVGKTDEKKKSKLRRAFSFGSASELRKATAQANLEKNNAAARSAKRNSKYEDELEPEQAAIAQRQEEGGLGESIYSGQGRFFTGSTDNLSISSTASSASIMLRKMGKGVKKSTKSLVGLFRPKSVIGVPAADGPIVAPTLPEISLVTVEAEREKVNVNVDPHDQAGGGTGFPKLERNSIDAAVSAVVANHSTPDIRSRRSIVGGEKERAEVLAAVKKGILKRTDSGQASPVVTPHTVKIPDFNLPQIPHVNDSPHSSAPSTPDDQPPRSVHRRTDSITIEGHEHEDYFSSITRFASMEAKQTPLTPHTAASRNISFSPRIQFHDTWTSSDYDRRGEIATCNRLTPMLAQQIKEELNTFKMEMEVHESSKVYTHFF